MKDNLSPPNLGIAPREYDYTFFHRAIRGIEIILSDLLSKGPVRVSTIEADSATVSGDVSAATFHGDGSALTNLPAADLSNLNASNLTSGTVPDARFPATLPAVSGANLTGLNGSNVSTGTIADARIASTIARDSEVVLNNGSTWTPHASTRRTTVVNEFWTDYGYIQLGPQNTSTAHIYTDRPSFYFNKELLVNDKLVYNRSNILGSVGQASGIPTGAIIERVTNANGTYTRFADGTQICQMQRTLSGTGWTATAWGGYKDAGGVTYPAAFIEAPTVLAQAHDGNVGARSAYVSFALPSTGGIANVWLASPGSVADSSNIPVHFIAIGRWF